MPSLSRHATAVTRRGGALAARRRAARVVSPDYLTVAITLTLASTLSLSI